MTPTLTPEEQRLIEWQQIELRQQTLLDEMRADAVRMLSDLVMAGLDWTQIAQSLGWTAPYVQQLARKPGKRITPTNIERLHGGLQDLLQKTLGEGTGQAPES